MRYFSTFSGIGGFELAMPKDWECVGYSEIDKYAIQIYSKHFLSHKNFGDITQINIPSLPDFDLLVGGSPCQDLSIAKKDRKGLGGDRSGLFYKFVEILKKKKPKYFLLENVNSMPKESKKKISEILGVEPIMINAALVSAQNRKRLFWCNWEVEQPEDKGILLKDVLEKNVDLKFCISSTQKHATILENKSTPLTAAMGMGGGHIPMLSNNPKRIGQIGKGGQADRIYSIEGKSVNLSANGGGRGAKTGLYAVALRNRGEGKKPEIGGNKANAMTTVQTDSMVMENYQIRKLTPIECERLQCFPDGWTEGLSNTQRYKTLGNAVNVEVVKHILKQIQDNLFQ